MNAKTKFKKMYYKLPKMKSKGITIRASDFRCICGKQGEFLNINFDSKLGNALCKRCRDKEILKEKSLKQNET